MERAPTRLCSLALALCLGGFAAASAGAEEVDLELILAVDVSGSMDLAEQELQRAGYVAALMDGEVLHAIRSGPYGRIAISYVEWAGPSAQAVAVPWQIIADEAGPPPSRQRWPRLPSPASAAPRSRAPSPSPAATSA